MVGVGGQVVLWAEGEADRCEWVAEQGEYPADAACVSHPKCEAVHCPPVTAGPKGKAHMVHAHSHTNTCTGTVHAKGLPKKGQSLHHKQFQNEF